MHRFDIDICASISVIIGGASWHCANPTDHSDRLSQGEDRAAAVLARLIRGDAAQSVRDGLGVLSAGLVVRAAQGKANGRRCRGSLCLTRRLRPAPRAAITLSIYFTPKSRSCICHLTRAQPPSAKSLPAKRATCWLTAPHLFARWSRKASSPGLWPGTVYESPQKTGFPRLAKSPANCCHSSHQ